MVENVQEARPALAPVFFSLIVEEHQAELSLRPLQGSEVCFVEGTGGAARSGESAVAGDVR